MLLSLKEAISHHTTPINLLKSLASADKLKSGKSGKGLCSTELHLLSSQPLLLYYGIPFMGGCARPPWARCSKQDKETRLPTQTTAKCVCVYPRPSVGSEVCLCCSLPTVSHCPEQCEAWNKCSINNHMGAVRPRDLRCS